MSKLHDAEHTLVPKGPASSCSSVQPLPLVLCCTPTTYVVKWQCATLLSSVALRKRAVGRGCELQPAGGVGGILGAPVAAPSFWSRSSALRVLVRVSALSSTTSGISGTCSILWPRASTSEGSAEAARADTTAYLRRRAQHQCVLLEQYGSTWNNTAQQSINMDPVTTMYTITPIAAG